MQKKGAIAAANLIGQLCDSPLFDIDRQAAARTAADRIV